MKRISFILFSTVHFACWCSFLFQSWELSLLRSSICLSLHNVFTCSSKRSCASPSNSSVSPSQPLYCGSGLLKIIPPVWCSVVIISEQSSRCLKIYILYRSSRVFLFRVPSDLRIPSATRPHSVTILAIVHGMLHRYSYGFTGHALILTLGLHWTHTVPDPMHCTCTLFKIFQYQYGINRIGCIDNKFYWSVIESFVFST